MNQNKKNWWLYILKLENGKWYVGITSKTPEERFRQHKNGFLAAAWTKRHSPVSIHYTEDLGNCSIDKAQLYEGRVTRKYMEKYGDNNVRGGDLTDDEEYIRRFGRFFPKSGWEIITTVVMLLLVILLFVLDKYQWSVEVFAGLIFTSAAMIVATEVFLRKRNKS